VNVSPNRRYLEHDGKPFFYLADTAWKLFTAPSESEAQNYFRVRRDQGFSVIMPVLATERARGEEGEQSALVDDDPDRPNEEYFAKVDRYVEYANGLGLWMALLPAWGSYVVGGARGARGDAPVFDEASGRRYGAYVGRRYKDKNVIWVNGGDKSANDPGHRAVWRAIAEGLGEGDPGLRDGTRVMTWHPPGLRPDPKVSGSSALWFHDDDWLDFTMLQTGLRFLEEDLCARYVAEYTREPTKPFLDGETRYENSRRNFALPPTGPKIQARHVRQAAHYAMLCGALGHTYGCRDAWSFYVPTDAPPTRGVDMHWKDALHLKGVEQLRHWRRLFEDECPWFRLSPDLSTIGWNVGPNGGDQNEGALVTRGAWDGTGNIRTPAAVADDGSFAVLYLPEQMPVWVDLSKLAGDEIEATWLDPRTGTRRFVGRYTDKSEVRLLPRGAEDEPDWVLILRTA
jgi:hypothetical protein